MYVILKMKGDYNMDNINMDYINEFRNDNYYLSKRHPFIFIQESFGIVHPLGTTILNPYSLW